MQRPTASTIAARSKPERGVSLGAQHQADAAGGPAVKIRPDAAGTAMGFKFENDGRGFKAGMYAVPPLFRSQANGTSFSQTPCIGAFSARQDGSALDRGLIIHAHGSFGSYPGDVHLFQTYQEY